MDNYINTAIDSFKLRIKEKRIRYTEKGNLLLNDTFVIISNTTGEIKDWKENSYTVPELKEKGISLRIAKEKVTQVKGYIGNHLTLGINSKLLKKDYLKGITNETIKTIYDEIMKLDIFFCSFDEFKRSHITDVDVKNDITNIENMKKDVLFMESKLKNSLLYSGKKELGLEMGNRTKTKKVITRPFIKFYSKKLELMYNSKTFYDNYIKGQDIDYLRVEGTIKNAKHWRSILNTLKLEKRDFTLENVLNLTDQNKIDLLKSFLSKYIITKNGKVMLLNKSKLTTNPEIYMYLGLKGWLMGGGSLNDWEKVLMLNLKEGTARDRVRESKRIYEMLKNDVDVKSLIYRNEYIDDLFSFNM